MFRTNGGLIGKYRPPTIGAAPGIWSPAEQILAKQGQIWASNDPYFDKVSLLMHMEGPNNSTDFIDSSFNNLTITKVGSPIITATSRKFGSSCASIPNLSYLQTPTSGLFNFSGAIDFTAELWVKRSLSEGSNQNIISFVKNASYLYVPFTISVGSRNLNYSIASSNLSGSALSGSTTGSLFLENVWHHVAVVGYNGILTVYFNGSSVASIATPSWVQLPWPMRISESSNFNATAVLEFDEIRVTKGVARYTSNFTVPNSQFPDG